jgi:hypothetical protein
MLAMVSSGSSVRIFIILGNLMILGQILKVRKDGLLEYHVVAPLGFYILGNLMIPGKIPRDCQSTTKCCCYTCLILLLYDDDVVAPASCCDDVVAPASCC